MDPSRSRTVPKSHYRDAAEHAGVTYTSLIQRLLTLALEGRSPADA